MNNVQKQLARMSEREATVAAQIEKNTGARVTVTERGNGEWTIEGEYRAAQEAAGWLAESGLFLVYRKYQSPETGGYYYFLRNA